MLLGLAPALAAVGLVRPAARISTGGRLSRGVRLMNISNAREKCGSCWDWDLAGYRPPEAPLSRVEPFWVIAPVLSWSLVEEGWWLSQSASTGFRMWLKEPGPARVLPSVVEEARGLVAATEACEERG